MQRLNPAKALSTVQRENSKKSACCTNESAVQSTVTLARLWLTMIGVWGHRWTAHHGDLPVREDGTLTLGGMLWANGLAGFSEEQIMAAVQHVMAKGDEWPPSLPAFRKACFGIPTFSAVRDELRHNKSRRSPFLCQVWSYIDGYMFARSDEQRAERMLHEAYDLAVAYVMSGGKLLDPMTIPIQAPKPERHKPSSHEVARAELAKMAALLRENEPAVEQVEAESAQKEVA